MFSTGSYRNLRLEVRSLAEPFDDADEIATSDGDIVVISVSAGDVRSSLHPACRRVAVVDLGAGLVVEHLNGRKLIGCREIAAWLVGL